MTPTTKEAVQATMRVVEHAADRFARAARTSQSEEGVLALAFLSAMDGQIKPEEAPAYRNTIAALCVIALLAFPVVANCLEQANSGIDQTARRNLLCARLAMSFDANPAEVIATVEQLLAAKRDGEL